MAESESPTVVEKPSDTSTPRVAGSAEASVGVRSSLGVRSSTPSLTATISEQAVDALEAHRMRGLMAGIASSSLFTTFIVLVVGGDQRASHIHAIALALTALESFAAALWFRDAKRYKPQIALYVILTQIAVLITGYYFWGVFSAYGALVPLTVYIACGSATRGEAIGGVGALVIAQTTFSLLQALDYIAPRGLVEPVIGRADLRTQLVAIGLIQVITIGAAIAGRAARKDSVAALEAHNKALLDLARREAQLAEAYADARAAREAGLGGMGRFTDQQIDSFKLGEVLGRGAMGEVYAATRIDDETPIAVKVLAPHLLRDTGARDRFLRESAIVSAISSPHVVRVLSVAPADALVPYIAMELLEGTDLGQVLKKRNLLVVAEVEQIVTHVAAGLDAAHKAGVIHRDLKPSNIFATGEGETRVWKLLDFGASKWTDGEGTLTRDAVVGTPGYMAPEQALGRSVDKRSDVYALGVVLYRSLTGVPAVVPGEVPAMLQEVAYRMPMQPSKRAPLLTDAIEAVLAISLAKSPMHRFATAGDLASAFRAAVDGKLDRAIRQRADAVLADLPWGAWQRRS